MLGPAGLPHLSLSGNTQFISDDTVGTRVSQVVGNGPRDIVCFILSLSVYLTRSISFSPFLASPSLYLSPVFFFLFFDQLLKINQVSMSK